MHSLGLARVPVTLGTCTIACAVWAASATAGEYNPVLNIGDKAPAWGNLPGVDGKEHSLAELKDKEAIVVVFTCNSCPYAVDYEDRIIAFAKQHARKDGKVALIAINVNAVEEDSLPKMKERSQKKGFPFAYLYDESQEIAREYGATYTPEFFVLDRDRKIVYMGALDDDTDADKATVNYVALAVEAAIAGQKPKTTETVAVGCLVRFARKRRAK